MTIANSVFNRHRNHGGNLIAAIAEARELATSMESNSCINRVYVFADGSKLRLDVYEFKVIEECTKTIDPAASQNVETHIPVQQAAAEAAQVLASFLSGPPLTHDQLPKLHILLGRAFERTREAIEDIEARRPDSEG